MEMQMNVTDTIAAEEALAQLAAQAPPKKYGPPLPPLPPPPPRKFAFTEIGEQIIASLMKAADEQVEAAQALREEVMGLADSISTALEAQAKRMQAMDARTKEFGLAVLDAHKKFLNGGEHDNPTP
jgi:hypothetical protein